MLKKSAFLSLLACFALVDPAADAAISQPNPTPAGDSVATGIQYPAPWRGGGSPGAVTATALGIENPKATVGRDIQDCGAEGDSNVRAGAPLTCFALTKLDRVPPPRAGAQEQSPEAEAAAAEVALAGPFPPQCSMYSGELTEWVAMDRKTACVHRAWNLELRQLPSQAVLGSATVHEAQRLTADDSAGWNTEIDILINNATSPNVYPNQVQLALVACPEDCVSSFNTQHPAFDLWRASGYYGDSLMVAGDINYDIWHRWDAVFVKAGSSPARGEFGGVYSRCDSAIGGYNPRCVFANIPGELRIDPTGISQFRDHVLQAQASGLPGGIGSGTYLTRLMDSTLNGKNGSTACPQSLNRPTGYQCDEYPFRSTYQGAFTATDEFGNSMAGVARSFNGCQMPQGDLNRTGPNGWSRCFINETQNLSAGGRLGGQYGEWRILDGDKFQVGF